MTAGPDPVASIVVPSYRGVDRLPALLDSLAAQQEGTPPFEVIVVVDGVDDGSVALLEAERRLTLRSILLPENRGRVTALNTGFEAARGEVLIRCDDDLVVPPTYVVAHMEAHPAGESVGVVGLTRDVHQPSPYARAYGEDAAARSSAGALARPAGERWRLWAASCSISRSTWERIGRYDLRYRAYGWEDIDYGYRLHHAGIPILLAPGATAEHHGPARTAAARARKAFESGAARATFLHLHPEAPLPAPSAGHGPWGAAVRVTARGLTSARAAERAGTIADRLLPRVPVPVGRKLVALAVEAAGLAGTRTGSRETGATS
ncbi:glycosyltransferase [Brachybacterium sp. NBEC-018]|uniref:glycosyltransferase family 2 protein n=1 Tax=Brachybacterium sp. NBEC-018 TaxID=2996004 RepID=UPI00217547D3|nr:glycosyltransferase [Brachybacterium sp. NBEC-018]UVY84837.1 glycosyltransferase [Brachybacterium sp. NBEC-018]